MSKEHTDGDSLQEDADMGPEASDSEPANVPPGLFKKILELIVKQLTDDISTVEQWVKIERTNLSKTGHYVEIVSLEANLALAKIAVNQAATSSARSGFVTGLGDFAGPAGFFGATGVDFAYAAKLAVQMAQRIYCIFGHDISDDFVKVQMMEALGGKGAVVGKAAGKAGAKAGKKLTEKYLKGALLKFIKAFFARLGFTFTKKALIGWMPVVGSGVNYYVNKGMMRGLGNDVMKEARGM